MNLVVATRELIPHVNRVVTEAHTARAENEAETEGAPQNGCAEMRTQILNLLIVLVIVNFVLNF